MDVFICKLTCLVETSSIVIILVNQKKTRKLEMVIKKNMKKIFDSSTVKSCIENPVHNKNMLLTFFSVYGPKGPEDTCTKKGHLFV